MPGNVKSWMTLISEANRYPLANSSNARERRMLNWPKRMMAVVRSLRVDTALYTATKAGEGCMGVRTKGMHATKTKAEIAVNATQKRNSRDPTAARVRKAPLLSTDILIGSPGRTLLIS